MNRRTGPVVTRAWNIRHQNFQLGGNAAGDSRTWWRPIRRSALWPRLYLPQWSRILLWSQGVPWFLKHLNVGLFHSFLLYLRQNSPLSKMKVYTEATIVDIAREWNVSKSTVSRGLETHHSIGEASKKAVLDLAKKYYYHPHNIAYSLSKKSTKTIGVLVPMLSH